jgi:acyl carrier protein
VNPDEAKQIIVTAIARVAPEIDPSTIDPSGELQLEADLDSMDFLHLIETVSLAVGHDIAERDYPQLSTLDAFADYLVQQSVT